MKPFLFALGVMLLVGSPVLGVDGPTPAPAAETLKVNKDGMVKALDTGKPITFPNGVAVTAATLGLQKELYIAVRTDNPPCVSNVCGSGTKLDPFNAGGVSPSQQAVRLTSIWTTYNSNANFYYAPGTYYTNGWLAGSRKTANPNCKHFGAGRGNTIITLYGATIENEGFIFKASYDSPSPGFELHDMTLNCDALNQPKWTNPAVVAKYIGGVSLLPDEGVLIDNVEIINFGTNSAGVECFPLFLIAEGASPVRDYKNATVQNCYVHSPVNGTTQSGVSAIVLEVNQAGSTATNLRAINNVVDLTGTTYEYTHGVTAQFSESNTSIGCSVGLYIEPTGSYQDYTSTNDRFFYCDLSIYSLAKDNATCKGIYIRNPIIVNAPGAAHGGININSDDHTDIVYREVIIDGARMILSDGSIDSTYVKMDVNSTPRLTITNNRINSAHPWYFKIISPSGGILTNISENRTTTGVLPMYRLDGVMTSQRSGVLTDNSGNTTFPSNTTVTGTGTAALWQGSHSGNGSLLTQVQARNVEAASRTVTNADITYNNADVIIIIGGPLTGPHAVTLPAASGNSGRFLYLVDESGTVSTNNYTVSPNLKSGGYVFNVDNGKAVFRSNGTQWVLWDLFTPP